MAVIENSINFGGVDSAEFGIFISGEGVFNAPKRAVEVVSVPGRNGDVLIDQGHWENIEITYPAFNYEPDMESFRQALSDFRNAICSKVGYQRLTDTFHPDEYRMAAFIDDFEIKPISRNTAAQFEIKFNAKPQRWLTSGEEPVTINGGVEKTVTTGEVSTLERYVSFSRPFSVTDALRDDVANALNFVLHTEWVELDVGEGAVIDNWSFSEQQTEHYKFEGGLADITTTDPFMFVKGRAVTYDYEYASGEVAYTSGGVSYTDDFRVGVKIEITENGTGTIYVVLEGISHKLAEGTEDECFAVGLGSGYYGHWAEGFAIHSIRAVEGGLYNPSPVNSGPLLLVDGYGEIRLGDSEITLAEGQMGWVQMFDPVTSYPGALNATINTRAAIEPSMYNDGDSIDFDVFRVQLWLAPTGFSSITNVTLEEQSPDGATWASISYTHESAATATATVTIALGTGATGTSIIKSDRPKIRVHGYDTGGIPGSFAFRITLGANYNGARQLSFSAEIPFIGTQGIFTSAAFNGATVYSTVNILGHPTYIDCENGDAYKIEGGAVESLNRFISLGSDLPVLKPGYNNITIVDDTITSLQIKPNWWKL